VAERKKRLIRRYFLSRLLFLQPKSTEDRKAENTSVRGPGGDREGFPPPVPAS
jgi:hypothetical protein